MQQVLLIFPNLKELLPKILIQLSDNLIAMNLYSDPFLNGAAGTHFTLNDYAIRFFQWSIKRLALMK